MSVQNADSIASKLAEALTDTLPYLHDLIALEKAGIPSGFKKGVVQGHIRAAEKALANFQNSPPPAKKLNDGMNG